MRTVAITMGGLCALLSSLVVVGSDLVRRTPPTCRPISRRSSAPKAATSGEIGTKNILQLNTTMFELYGDAGQDFQKEHPGAAPASSSACSRGPVDGSSSIAPAMAPLDAPSVPIVYQLLKSVGHSTMALAEVVVPYLNSPERPDLARLARRLPQPHAVRARRPRRDRHAGRLAADQPQHPAEQHRVHGRVPEDQRDLAGRAAGICQETGAAAEEEHRLGSADPGRALDGRDRRLEADARRRLGQDLRRPATRSTSPARTTSCSACWRSSSGRRPSTTG